MHSGTPAVWIGHHGKWIGLKYVVQSPYISGAEQGPRVLHHSFQRQIRDAMWEMPILEQTYLRLVGTWTGVVAEKLRFVISDCQLESCLLGTGHCVNGMPACHPM
jgi:hypothetical protein